MAPRNNWDVGYPSILFLERALRSHKLVKGFTRDQDILFTIERWDTLCRVIALLVNRYTISLADVITAKAEFPTMTCIVAPGNWCGYTQEAKEYGLQHEIGVFHVGEFLSALWHKNPVGYTQKDGDGKPIYAYRSA
jgi:hypothetical protein